MRGMCEGIVKDGDVSIRNSLVATYQFTKITICISALVSGDEES